MIGGKSVFIELPGQEVSLGDHELFVVGVAADLDDDEMQILSEGIDDACSLLPSAIYYHSTDHGGDYYYGNTYAHLVRSIEPGSGDYD